ncbi:serine protease [Glaciecola punicea]|jgi:serine protease DegS|uniref:trypsin-like peptidase domain-containing protein n=1 Tax=Glaciecola punicea TaxID=56804 RepID=UPI000872EA0E|nr:trypsin-like peptidase domain-containing protein [Glaciecola punicea]OFA30509.1 serine protease [Glaciecola punicea]
MSLFPRFLLALLKPIILGVVVAALLLFLFPEFRQGEGLKLNWLNQERNVPQRLSYYDALAISAPAVVNIYSVSLENSNRLFRSRPIERTNLGSGVIMREDGYLLTCYHVIRNADSIYVSIQDGRFLPAQLVGFDEITDLAVLRIFEQNLPVIPQVEEPNLRVGDVVMAIGNPLDLGQTVTSGIVSRLGRNGLANYFDRIQTDAVLNPGNSGGALIDSNGFLVGITNANFKTLDSRRRVQDVNGVNFALPYPLAKRVMDEIIDNGRVRRGQLGFSGNGYDNRGILVESVAPNGPAAEAGLRVNDLLLSVNGEDTIDLSKTLDLIAGTRPGAQLELVVSRNDELITMTVTVGELNPDMVFNS